ncbi:hypothetical protein AXF42_Ash008851 [Apostasia shenzhenica]|uniref:COP1-interacting protein 7 n=1 Tax=Apostasia shenzhenica TaxID=1088818 RepID=A0A2I0ASP3_9ASPA|nr:hypothetical protein AXF42_Ash008851 [Apostasia shenzhenica]
MVGEIAENAVLDYAIFEISSSDNRYDAYICSNGSTEKLVSGPLDQLIVHLPEARVACSKSSLGSFKLQVDQNVDGTSWFTRFTLVRFLHIVNVPNVLKLANSIENEISQLEETKRFHLALYAKDPMHRSGGGVADVSCLNDSVLTQQVKVETASSDATKNELLRAMDLRLTALKEELGASFNRAAGATCCSNQISNVAVFAQHFGAIDLRDLLLKFLELCPDHLSSETSREQSVSRNDSTNTSEKGVRVITQLGQKPDVVRTATTSISPAKIAEAERQSSSESEDSSDSVDGDQPHAERSRSIVRSATPRRSASPMRRIQIGRSGSRRSTGLSIKSLNYFPARERAISNQAADASEGGDEELQENPKKPDNSVKRMSVQDAINLFESKQKDQNADIQKRRTSELAFNANKLVLRRWSSGVCDSVNCSTQEKVSDSGQPIDSGILNPGTEEKKLNEVMPEFSSPDHTPAVMPAETINTDISVEPVVKSEVVESKNRASTAEWNRQKEAELNDLLLKMMENKPTKYRGSKIGKAELHDLSTGKNTGFHSQYKAKRDEKLEAEYARDNVTKDAQSKLMRKTLEQSKAATVSRNVPATLRRESTSPSQRPRRNSSPPVFSKKDDSKPTITKKISSKPAASPKIRTSSPSGPVKRTSITPPTKSSQTVADTCTSSLQRPQHSNSTAEASLRTGRLLQHGKGNKSASSFQADLKPNLKGQEEKKLKSMTKNSKAVTTRCSEFRDDFVAISSKSSFHNKFTKKSSVVPLESRPYLRKGSRISPGTGHAVAKVKDATVLKSDDSSKNSGNLVPAEENESNAATAESVIDIIEDDLIEESNVVNETLAAPVDTNMNIETTENLDESLTGTCMETSVEPSIPEIQPDEDLGISSAAWVEAEHREHAVIVASPIITPTASSSPRVRHSLSQMLQADSGEPEIIEWGNAENPPSLVYQKDAPKGLKRLLKFARKSKGEGYSTGCSSPSAFSEGEDENEEFKAAGKKNSDAVLRKVSLQAKGYGQPKPIILESFDGGNAGKRAVNYKVAHDFLSGSDKLRDGQISVGVTSAKATRSFFSLSTFRSGKSSETKPR